MSRVPADLTLAGVQRQLSILADLVADVRQQLREEDPRQPAAPDAEHEMHRPRSFRFDHTYDREPSGRVDVEPPRAPRSPIPRKATITLDRNAYEQTTEITNREGRVERFTSWYDGQVVDGRMAPQQLAKVLRAAGYEVEIVERPVVAR